MIPGFLNQKSCCCNKYTKILKVASLKLEINTVGGFFLVLFNDLQFSITREPGDRTCSPKLHRVRTDVRGEEWEWKRHHSPYSKSVNHQKLTSAWKFIRAQWDAILACPFCGSHEHKWTSRLAEVQLNYSLKVCICIFICSTTLTFLFPRNLCVLFFPWNIINRMTFPHMSHEAKNMLGPQFSAFNRPRGDKGRCAFIWVCGRLKKRAKWCILKCKRG